MTENETLAHRFHMDIFKEGKLGVADEIVARDFVIHGPGVPPEMQRGPEGVKRYATAIRTAFPDMPITHHDTIAQGDKVVIRWTAGGTHRGELLAFLRPASR